MKSALCILAGLLAAVPGRGEEIRVWGSAPDSALLQAWAQGYARVAPAAHLTFTLHGPESAMMGVYTGVAEAALMAREMRVPAETMAFTWAWRYPPTVIEVANAGIDTSRPNAALAVWVNSRNPLKGLTLAQLDAVYGAERKRGGAAVTTWGDLGVGGEWAARPVHLYGPAIDSVSGLYFRSAVLQGSYKWKAELQELPSDADVATAVAKDEFGIGYGGARSPNALRLIPLSATNDGPFVALTRATAIDRTYPLSRVVTMVINRKPNSPIDPKTLGFLRFILSPDGQAIVARTGGCLPLTAEQAGEQRELLE